ncbi:hypothetical protein LCGC14_0417590 [marine sediment metagenome]|uniref:Uncharacterized protein n=1 Tax=marine sediment metagenome TaxID=412755 RepID=A0A0F9SY22_9ZZZZ
MVYSLYGLTKQLREKLQKIANKKNWTLAKLIIDILEQYLGVVKK